MLYIWLAFFLALVLTGSTPSAAAQRSGNAFEPVPCDRFDLFENAPGAVEGQDVTCGYLTVPERQAAPAGETIQLAILIIKSTSDTPAPDPLLLTQGGPGGSGIHLFSNLAAPDNELGQLLRADRELIVFEQRGTLYSEPFLFCEEVFDFSTRTLDQLLNDQEDRQQTLAAFASCRTRLVDEGVDLAAYNSLENADDIATLVEALDYDQINFYGVSYGSMLGQHLMRRHPRLLRSVILDGIVPLQVNPNLYNPFDRDTVLQALVPLALPVVAWVGLVLFPVIWFIGWVVNRLRQAPRERRGPARLAPWVGLLLAMFAAAFVVSQAVGVGMTVLEEPVFEATAGLSRSFIWIFIFPWLITFTTLGMVVLAVLSWLKGYWGLLARLYYSLTTLLALIFTGLLISIGSLAVIFT